MKKNKVNNKETFKGIPMDDSDLVEIKMWDSHPEAARYTWEPSEEDKIRIEKREARKALDKTDLDNFKL